MWISGAIYDVNLNKQTKGRWFQTQWRSCDVTVMPFQITRLRTVQKGSWDTMISASCYRTSRHLVLTLRDIAEPSVGGSFPWKPHLTTTLWNITSNARIVSGCSSLKRKCDHFDKKISSQAALEVVILNIQSKWHLHFSAMPVCNRLRYTSVAKTQTHF